MTEGGQLDHKTTLSLTRIRTLHERPAGKSAASRHEKWSLVEVGCERRVLFEAREGDSAEESEPLIMRLMTVRDALREPRDIARHIWLSLED